MNYWCDSGTRIVEMLPYKSEIGDFVNIFFDEYYYNNVFLNSF
jgi:hypothetical protein